MVKRTTGSGNSLWQLDREAPRSCDVEMEMDDGSGERFVISIEKRPESRR